MTERKTILRGILGTGGLGGCPRRRLGSAVPECYTVLPQLKDLALVIIALVICKLRGNLRVLLPIGKIMIGKANSSEANQVRQTLSALLDLTPRHQQLPDLPERRKPLQLTSEASSSVQKSILPSSTDIQRYEKYLSQKKEEIKKSKR